MNAEFETIRSVCLFCGSSTTASEVFLEAASDFGRRTALAGLRLVYGGGEIGLMGAAAKAAHGAGGEVLGIIPSFLTERERLYAEVDTRVVGNMHERKRLMFEESDAIVAMPGGIGTLEEIIELLSWRRMNLHAKPIVFVNLNGFWNSLFDFIQVTIDEQFTPPWLDDTWMAVTTVADVLPALRKLNTRTQIDGSLVGTLA